jgi:serine/threonine protein kinase
MSENASPQQGASAPKRKEAVKLSQTLTIAKRIGRGRLGVVYAAVHSVLARRFAVKVLRPSLTAAEDVQQRLRHMIREASQVEHNGICNLVDFGQLPDRRFYLTMDFVRGIQLSSVLERDGRLELSRVVPIMMQLAEALDSAHRMRVAHGDIKPSNVMLLDDTAREDEEVKIIDFRISPALSPAPAEGDPTAHLRGYGGLEYLAPEQLAGRNWDGRSDIYSLGCLAYRMLTGQAPFIGEPHEVLQGHRDRDPVPPSRRSGGEALPEAIDAIVLRCLEKSPSNRYKSMDELVRELHALMPKPSMVFEEEVTGRWEIEDLEEEVEQQEEEPLPESPGRLRRMFYETILELSEQIVDEEVASEDLQAELLSLKQVREEAAQLAAQVELAENRFEDIRRELRERESTLRYAIIDLNLAKSDLRDRQQSQEMRDLEFQIHELETSLAELERQRRERFAALNSDLRQTRDKLKAMEHQMAVHYRRLYAELDEVRSSVITQESRNLYRRLERCRASLTVTQPESDSHSAVRSK